MASAHLSEPIEKRFPIIVTFENHFSSVTAGHDVIGRSGILKTHRPRHVAILPSIDWESIKNVNPRGLTPFTAAAEILDLSHEHTEIFTLLVPKREPPVHHAGNTIINSRFLLRFRLRCQPAFLPIISRNAPPFWQMNPYSQKAFYIFPGILL